MVLVSQTLFVTNHPMFTYVPVYIVSVVVFFLIDMLWLGFVAPSLYKSQIGHLMADTVKWPIAILFYLLFLVGLLIFVLIPALEGEGLRHALIFGALFGFFTYATYDLTNWATLRDWPTLISLVDMAWGTVLTMAVSGVTYWIAQTYLI